MNDLHVTNAGSSFEFLNESEMKDVNIPEVQRMRGYRLKESAKTTFEYGFEKPLIRGEVFNKGDKQIQHVLSGKISAL